MTRVGIALLFLVAVARSAAAEPWYAGEEGKKRLLHMGVTAALGASFVVTEYGFKGSLASSHCRWCTPPAFDSSARNSLVWRDTDRAKLLSNINVYVVAPLVGFGLLVASDHDASWARLIDDTLPVMETVAVSQMLTQVIKFSVARRRPFVHFRDGAGAVDADDNMSFTSGHSSLGFAITTGAGMICHWRGYWTEPYVWGAGIALSVSTEYLRMAGDMHYLSDVVAGGAVGIAAGLLVPRLLRRDVQIVPINNGAAVVGMF